MTIGPAAEIARLLGDDLTEWQRKWLDEVFTHADKGDRLVYRFLGRKIGYGWAWEPAQPTTSGSR